jgi:hypothetical protein
MDISPRFESIWDGIENLAVPKEATKWCPYARQFAEWAANLISESQRPTLVELNQAKVMLTDRYYEWRSYVPKGHRNRIGPGGHRCIFHVFEQTYQKLKVIELSLTPPPLFLPPPPPPPPQIPSLFLGLEE